MEKVAIINTVLNSGSIGTLTMSLYNYGLKHGYDTYVFYGRGNKTQNNHLVKIDANIEVYVHKILSLLTGYQGCFSNFATSKLLNRLKRESIKKVILLNIHGYFLNEKRLLTYLKKNDIETLYVTPDQYLGLGRCCFNMNCSQYQTECNNCPHLKEYPRSLFFDSSKAIYRRKKESYRDFKRITVLGPKANLDVFRKSSLVKHLTMKEAAWGIDLDRYRYELNPVLYEKYNLPKDKILVLTVARYTESRKGVKKYFFEVARRLEGSEYHFINVGYDGNLKPEEIPSNLTTIGYLKDQIELMQLYSLSDVLLFPSIADTMPISCLISFACKTPVCCFYISGMKYLADRSDLSVHYCDEITVDGMENCLKKIGKKDEATMKACRQLAECKYSDQLFNKTIYDCFERKSF